MFPFLEGALPVQTVWALDLIAPARLGWLVCVCGVRVVRCNLSLAFLADRPRNAVIIVSPSPASNWAC